MLSILKILFLLFIIWVAYRVCVVLLFLNRAKNQFKQYFKETSDHEYKDKNPANDCDEMVKCAYCSTYVLKSSSITNNDKSFCSKEHLSSYKS